ncbi:MAG TPA: ester cyclase [Chitinophagaceae bacterium]
MKSLSMFFAVSFCAAAFLMPACDTNAPSIESAATEEANQNASVEKNMNHYKQAWNDIINNRKLEAFNDKNFTTDVVVHTATGDIKGIDSVQAYYANFITGFTDGKLIVNDMFGQGDKLVKYWTFKGTHNGVFFGIPATNKTVSISGTTLVLFKDGKIAEERDFFDNLELSQQLGLIPRQ